MEKLSFEQMEGVNGGLNLDAICGAAAIGTIVGFGFGGFWGGIGFAYNWWAAGCFVPQPEGN